MLCELNDKMKHHAGKHPNLKEMHVMDMATYFEGIHNEVITSITPCCF